MPDQKPHPNDLEPVEAAQVLWDLFHAFGPMGRSTLRANAEKTLAGHPSHEKATNLIRALEQYDRDLKASVGHVMKAKKVEQVPKGKGGVLRQKIVGIGTGGYTPPPSPPDKEEKDSTP